MLLNNFLPVVLPPVHLLCAGPNGWDFHTGPENRPLSNPALVKAIRVVVFHHLLKNDEELPYDFDLRIEIAAAIICGVSSLEEFGMLLRGVWSLQLPILTRAAVAQNQAAPH